MDVALDAALRRFEETHPVSKQLHENALKSLPGGNTRTLLHSNPFPVFIKKGKNHELFDEDGNRYCDLVGELTAGLYGHTHPRLQEALKSTIDDIGLSLGGTNAYEQRYASLLCSRFDLQRLRFTNSGTEANIHCIAAARQFTGRRKVVVFRGAYHGSVLSFGMGPAPNNIDLGDWILAQYNDVKGLEATFASHENSVAAVIVEAMQGSGGSIQASKEFLESIRNLTTKAGAVFIIDEVMTSRLGPGGLKSVLGVNPDMITLGKYLGGGMPFGAFGGREDIMAVYDPRHEGSLAHSGTFQNNVLMLNAGYVGLSEVYTPEAVESLNQLGDDLRHRLQASFGGTRFCVTGRGSLMCIHATTSGLQPEDIACKDNVADVEDTDLKRLFWLEMLNDGFWVQLRGSIALNLQTPVDALDSFVGAVDEFCKRHQKLIALLDFDVKCQVILQVINSKEFCYWGEYPPTNENNNDDDSNADSDDDSDDDSDNDNDDDSNDDSNNDSNTDSDDDDDDDNSNRDNNSDNDDSDRDDDRDNNDNI